MNAVTKIVFSKSLDHVEWGKYDNARLVHDILPDGIGKMKKLPGKDMVIYGSASIVREFTRLGLIDEYQFLVHPVILGAGRPFFKDFTGPVNLELTRSVNFKNGVVVQTYAPAGK